MNSFEFVPKSEFDSINQIRRAAKSVTANIADLARDRQKKSLKDS